MLSSLLTSALVRIFSCTAANLYNTVPFPLSDIGILVALLTDISLHQSSPVGFIRVKHHLYGHRFPIFAKAVCTSKSLPEKHIIKSTIAPVSGNSPNQFISSNIKGTEPWSFLLQMRPSRLALWLMF